MGSSEAARDASRVGEQAVPSVAANVVNRETGEDLDAGEERLLLVKGPNRMLGYLTRPAETAAVMRDGWYVTGDIVVMDSEGFITIVDRQWRFSKIAGEMVPHAKIEEAIKVAAPGCNCMVTSVADERRGERVVAFVAGDAPAELGIWQRLKASGIPNIWIPKADDIHRIETLPAIGTGKVDLRAVKRLAAEMEAGTRAAAEPV